MPHKIVQGFGSGSDPPEKPGPTFFKTEFRTDLHAADFTAVDLFLVFKVVNC